MSDPNIALNKKAGASSYVLPYSPSRAVDGTLQATSRWLCNTVPAYMTVDLGTTFVITGWTVRHMGTAGWVTPDYNMCDYSLQGSNDNVNWVVIDSIVNNTVAITSRAIVKAYRYVKLCVTKGLRVNPQYASLMELEINGHPPNANMSSLAVSSSSLIPTFNSTVLGYTTANVPYSTSSLTVSAAAEDATSTIMVNGTAMTGGQSIVNLNVGVNTINLLVKALDDVTTKTYTITVKREQGATLSNLAISSGTLNPIFSSGNLNYTTQNVGYDTASVTVTPTTNISGGTITLNGSAIISGQPSTVNLNVGSNTINIVVTNGTASQTYTIMVVREKSLYLDKVNLAYTGNRFTDSDVVDMNQTTLSYTAVVSLKASTVVMTPIAEDNGASVTITSNGSSQTVTSGATSSAISLPDTVNTISLVVSKSGAIGTKNYVLSINRA